MTHKSKVDVYILAAITLAVFVFLLGDYWIAGPSSRLSGYLSGFAATDQIYNSVNYFDSDRIDTGSDGLPEGSLSE